MIKTSVPLVFVTLVTAAAMDIDVPCSMLESAFQQQPSCCENHNGSKTITANTDCDATSVTLADYKQWSREDGYWLGEYSYYDGKGDPVYAPDSWNYPYDHYKGFITGSVHGGSYSQRNVFLYRPQTNSRCADNNKVAFDFDVCGTNGGIKKFEADQTTNECDIRYPGGISGPYNGKHTVTQLVGDDNALLYQVFNKVNGVNTLEHSQLTTITTLSDGSIHRTRTAQLFDSNAMTSPGRSGPPYRASFYRERKVNETTFFATLEKTLQLWNISSTAVGQICYGGYQNLKQFLEGGRTWPVQSKYKCPPPPVTLRIMRWTSKGAGKYHTTFGRSTVAGELVTKADIQAVSGLSLSAEQVIGHGWWEDAILIWAIAGNTNTFGRVTKIAEQVTDADIHAAASGMGRSPEQMVSSSFWDAITFVWTDLGARGANKANPRTFEFKRTITAGEVVTLSDIQAVNAVPSRVEGFAWSERVGAGWWVIRAIPIHQN